MIRGLWPISVAELARLTGGELLGAIDAVCERAVTDTRSGIRGGDLFVGLAGPHFEGSRYASQALAAGASAVLIDRQHAEVELAPGQAAILVEDPLVALQALAAEARRRFSGVVVAITGSNGKTTVKEMLVAALANERRLSASPLSYNSQVGVALSLLALDPSAEVLIVECGISLPGEMDRLEAMVRPDAGILTLIGDAHLEGLGNRAVTAREKARLFRRVHPREIAAAGGWVLALAGETLGREAILETGAPLRLVGDSPLELARRGERTVLCHGAEVLDLNLAEPAPHWLDDAALAAAAALLLGASPEAVEAGLAAWRPAPMRLEISTTPRGVTILNDAYTADPASLEAALATLVGERSGSHRRGATVAVLSGMAQLGRARGEAHARAGRRVAELGLDRLIAIGDGGAEIAAGALDAGMAPERVHRVADVAAAAMVLDEHCRTGDRVLLKGSRPERLERIAALLFDSVAPARLEIDLDAVLANFRGIRRLAGRERGVMAVIKSFGYGLDSVRIGRTLERAGVDYFAVAYPDEGVLLRDQGLTTPILVQNVLAHETDKIARYGLTAQITSLEQVRAVADEATRQRRTVRVHLKVDTGMGRSGAFPHEAVALANAVRAEDWLLLEGLFTHFASADDPEQDAFTREQIRRFDETRAALATAGFTFRWEHAAASAAVARFPEARYSMVRAGLALFGYARFPGGEPVLAQTPVLRLSTRVVALKDLPPGHAIGYGRTARTAEEPRRIAIVALGYSDGYPWALSNRGWMLMHGVRCPVLGRVSMDVTTLDVTALGERIHPGDEVVVFGPNPDEPNLLDLAELAGTIPYELLTRISPRVRRIFHTSA